jgi:acyl-CoA thioesterase-1
MTLRRLCCQGQECPRYSAFAPHLKRWVAALIAACALAAPAQAAAEAATETRLMVLGDSLTAGYGLPHDQAFPVRLEAALKKKGLKVRVIDAGVSGDTTAGGRSRIDWALADKPTHAIVELGANDALRGIDPKVTKAALDRLISHLNERGIAILLCGMRAPRNMGPDYARAFDAIFPALASNHDVLFYDFFLDGVAAVPKLNQDDGMHPNAAGVEVVVTRLLPKVEELIARARARRGS